MNPHDIEITLYMIALFALSCVMLPRLIFFLELRRLNDLTVRYLGTTSYLPKPILSHQHMIDASHSVQKALSQRSRDFRWMIKVHEHRDNIEQAVRIEGFVPVDKLAELNESQTNRSGQSLDIKITVDIYQRACGSEIVWKYMPNNASEFQRRRQVFDPAVSFLLTHTNFALMTELAHKP
jgi:hypothetical protein